MPLWLSSLVLVHPRPVRWKCRLKITVIGLASSELSFVQAPALDLGMLDSIINVDQQRKRQQQHGAGMHSQKLHSKPPPQ